MFLSPLGERLGEGTGANHLLDLRPYPLWILNDLIRPKAAHHTPAFTLHGCRPASIRFDLKGVMIAVDLDHQFQQ